MGIVASGATDIGLKRKTNQDSICLLMESHFFAVADGMGGHSGGDVASQLAVTFMPQFITSNSNLPPKQLVQDCIYQVNKRIIEEAKLQPHLKGMGTTISAIYFQGSEAFIGNVGDSRVYLIHKGQIFQLTKDHSYVQEKLNLGIYDRKEAALDKQKNVLTKSVGFEDVLEVDVFTYKISKNDLFLICSDGLHGKVSDRDILYIVQKNIPNLSQCTESDLKNAVDSLIAQANKNGGQDNISAIIALAQSAI